MNGNINIGVKSLILALILIFTLNIVIADHGGSVIRINAGGPDYLDSSGNTWEEDTPYKNTGWTFTSTNIISGTADQPLYQSERFDPSTAPELLYSIPVANGDYEVTLHFAEIWSGAFSPGVRVFDVSVEGTLELNDFDIFASAGANTAHTETIFTTVTDDELNILFEHVNQNPKISAIEIHSIITTPAFLEIHPDPVDFSNVVVGETSQINVEIHNHGGEDLTISSIAITGADAAFFTDDSSVPYVIAPETSAFFNIDFSPDSVRTFNANLEINSNDPSGLKTFSITGNGVTTPSEVEIRINSGGPAVVDLSGTTWEADRDFNTGVISNIVTSIAGTTHDQLYHLRRWDPGTTPELQYSIAVPNGDYTVNLHYAELWSGAFSNGARVFDVLIEGNLVDDDLDIFASAGSNTALIKTHEVTVNDGVLNLEFLHVTQNPIIAGIEILSSSEEPDHFAHSVPGPAQVVVDIDGNGVETVSMDGSFSHTHAFGENLIRWDWFENSVLLASGETVDIDFSVGLHTVVLEVEDSAGNTATDFTTVEVIPPSSVPGLTAHFYNFESTPQTSIPDFTLFNPEFAKIIDDVNQESTSLGFMGTSYNDDFGLDINGLINIDTTGTYGFAIESDDGSKLYINDALLIDNDGLHPMTKLSANIFLTAGQHKIDVEFIEATQGAGLKLYWTEPGQAEEVIPSSAFSHNQNSVEPFINSLTPNTGLPAGGNIVTISGIGFAFSDTQTTVDFGPVSLTGSELDMVDDKTIKVTSPSGTGNVQVSVTTPNGESNSKDFLYDASALPPVQFTTKDVLTGIIGPTTLTFGPDERLYIGTQLGSVYVLELDSNNNILNQIVSSEVQSSDPSFRSILGIAVDPRDTTGNPDIYVAHANLFHGQDTPDEAFNGKVSKLSGANYDTIEHIITGLPVSDHDHGINGMDFGENGELYIQIGGNTNAGVPSAALINLDEGIFSAGTVVAHIERENFDGHVTYDTFDPLTQVQTGGFDIENFAFGQRNPYDLVMHSNGKLYGTDNGPNFNFGEASTSCNTAGPDPFELDELNLLEEGKYYGHPNRNRGASDPRQCEFFPPDVVDPDHTQPLTIFPSSTNGITEYRANNFKGQLLSNLLVSRWQGELFNVDLSSNGQSVVSDDAMTVLGGLDVIAGPSGDIFIARQQDNKIIVHEVDEVIGSELYLTSAFPNKGTVLGGNEINIYGHNFKATTTVSIGGNSCSITSQTSTLITCTAPAGSSLGSVNVQVVDGSESDTVVNGYTYIADKFGGTGGPGVNGTWFNRANIPESLGEVSAASDGRYIYIAGAHDSVGPQPKFYRYDTVTDTWATLADQIVLTRGDHITQYYDGKIYAFGGLGPSGEIHDMRIYDIATDTWSLGSPLTVSGNPYGVLHPQSALINGKIYVAGGIHAGVEIDKTFVYDIATDSWTELAPMLLPRNHAAGIGYNGKMYVFSGRIGGNIPSPGLPESQVYDPSTNTWSFIADIPTPRGGMGPAVLINGELVVISGEGNGPVNGVFPHVEAYNPVTNTWRRLPDIPTPRHGITPVKVGDVTYVFGGGASQGFSHSTINEAYTTEQVPSNPEEVRINAGGPQFVDGSGDTWDADRNFNTGTQSTIAVPISGTTDDVLYHTGRWDPGTVPELEYSIPVVNGVYEVRIHLTETWGGAKFVGGRVFDISLEGSLVHNDVDVFLDVGADAALIKTSNVLVTDGILNILFEHEIQNPKVSAIELIPIS